MNTESHQDRAFGSSRLLLLLLAPLTAGLLACGGGGGGEQAAPAGAGAAPPPPEVIVTAAERANLPLELTYTASTRGSREVEVRARVSGILLSRHYEEGSFVKEGALLFKIDPAPFKAAVDAAAGALEVEKARLVRAEREKNRIGPLFDKNGVSQRERDDTVSEYEIAKASVMAAEARLKQAQLELGYTNVRAPISGFTSKETRSEGSLVQASSESSLLTRIVRLDPLYVEFALPDAEVRLLRQAAAPGKELAVPLSLELDSGVKVPQKATLDFLDSAVDATSGTLRARASLANADAALLPGQFLRVRVDGLQLDNVVIVPTRALMQGPTGPFVWVVGDGNVPAMTPVRTGHRHGDLVSIEEGLKGGELVVIEGLQKIFPGAGPVAPVRAPGGPA